MHGFFQCWSRDDHFFALYLNGKQTGPSWKRCLGGNFLYHDDPTIEEKEAEVAFIYPDYQTTLVGKFEADGSLKQAFEAEIEATTVTKYGILQPVWTVKEGQVAFVNEAKIFKDTICAWPLRPDPYELKHVQVKHSLIAEAGEGLFAIKVIKKGQIVAFFHGVPLEDDNGTDYSICCKFGESIMMDIPEVARSTDRYCATLGHKICHSFEPCAVYGHVFHPRFGKVIRCAISTRDIRIGEEITCDYKYRLDKAPAWYVKCLETYLQYSYHLDKEQIRDVIKASTVTKVT